MRQSAPDGKIWLNYFKEEKVEIFLVKWGGRAALSSKEGSCGWDGECYCWSKSRLFHGHTSPCYSAGQEVLPKSQSRYWNGSSGERLVLTNYSASELSVSPFLIIACRPLFRSLYNSNSIILVLLNASEILWLMERETLVCFCWPCSLLRKKSNHQQGLNFEQVYVSVTTFVILSSKVWLLHLPSLKFLTQIFLEKVFRGLNISLIMEKVNKTPPLQNQKCRISCLI